MAMVCPPPNPTFPLIIDLIPELDDLSKLRVNNFKKTINPIFSLYRSFEMTPKEELCNSFINCNLH